MALDAAGQPHLAYAGDSLTYAWHDGTGWHVEIVDPAPGIEGLYQSAPCLALDASGTPRLSNLDSRNEALQYARKTAQGWEIQSEICPGTPPPVDLFPTGVSCCTIARRDARSEAEHLSDALQGLFADPDHGWFTAFVVTTAGLTAAKHATVPAPRFNSIWAVVNHLRFWQEVMLLRLRGLLVDRQALGAEEGWPPARDRTDEQAWQAVRGGAIAVNKELAAPVAGLTDEEFAQPLAPGRARRYQVVQGIIAHNCYRTCEIISIRHMQGLWLERT